MSDGDKTKQQLIGELNDLRKQLDELRLTQSAVQNSEAALRKSEERYKNLTESLPEMVFELDVAGRITYVNKAAHKTFGFTPEEFASGMGIADLIVPEQLQLAQQNFAKVLRDGEFPTYEYLARKKDGSTFPALVYASPITANNEMIGARGIVIDITERKRAEEERRNLEKQIQHAQKLESLGVLAGGIAHDFNNLLMGIIGNVELALMEISAVSPARNSVTAVKEISLQAADLCKQMLAYSGKGSFVIQNLDLNELVQEMTHLLKVSTSKKAAVKYNYAGGLPSIKADPTQIRQVILNLITNASEAIGDTTGVITISTGSMDCDRVYLKETFLDADAPEGNYVYLEVADTGGGIDEETKQRIFDPFYSTKFTGRGMGLSAVLGIVRSHKGAIKLYSEPKKGTVFKVLFPASDQPADPLEKEPDHVPQWRGQGTILLVDDDRSVRTVVRAILKEFGFAVLSCADGKEAVEVYRDRADEIVCVLLDLTMPNMDGRETFRELRRIRNDVKVILSSGYNEQEVMHEFSGKGLADFIQKPYRVNDLIPKLKKVLSEK